MTKFCGRFLRSFRRNRGETVAKLRNRATAGGVEGFFIVCDVCNACDVGDGEGSVIEEADETMGNYGKRQQGSRQVSTPVQNVAIAARADGLLKKFGEQTEDDDESGYFCVAQVSVGCTLTALVLPESEIEEYGQCQAGEHAGMPDFVDAGYQWQRTVG